jgi:hypothetical protein
VRALVRRRPRLLRVRGLRWHAARAVPQLRRPREGQAGARARRRTERGGGAAPGGQMSPLYPPTERGPKDDGVEFLAPFLVVVLLFWIS